MIKITVPNNNINERKYILDIIFNEFLGLEYSLATGSQHYKIELENKKILSIEDRFFSKYPEDLEYLHINNIPSKIEELDIFSASFFMLTRWEECVNKNRDSHGRFPAYESLAFKQGFLERPVVNEYVEKLKRMLLELDSRIIFKKYRYKFMLTHDIDTPFKFYSMASATKTLAGDLIKRRDIKLFLQNLVCFVKSKFNYKEDPFYTFDFILKMNKKYDISSFFFFMSGGTTNKDNFYKIGDKRIRQLAQDIKKDNNFIGIHPSYNSYSDSTQFQKEKRKLENILNLVIEYGRQHYLNFTIPGTWQNWEDENMIFDSTLGYADRPGFRCGTCYEFNVFNILTREKLSLKEKPLIAMECSLFEERYLNLSYNDSYKMLISLMDTVKKYNGEFVLLWHNDRLVNERQKELYNNILNYSNTTID